MKTTVRSIFMSSLEVVVRVCSHLFSSEDAAASLYDPPRIRITQKPAEPGRVDVTKT